MLQAKRQSGQILLILVMIMAIAVTVVLTITFTSRTDTQLTKLEEESQKALAAAEAGIEATLKNNAGIDTLQNVGGLGTTISSGKTTLATSTTATPSLRNGEAYTLYLAPFNPQTGVFTNPSADNNITIYYSTSGSCNGIILDIAIVTTASVVRYVADTQNLANTGTTDIGVVENNTVNGTVYNCKTSPIVVTSASNPRFMIVRFVSPNNNPSSIAATFGAAPGPLPVQGQTVNSQATTKTGVTKVVELFQSYPQIPAEFFFTSF